MRAVWEAGDRAAVAEDPGGGDHPDPLDAGQRGAAGGHRLGDAPVVGGQLDVRAAHIVEQIAGQLPSDRVDLGCGSDSAQHPRRCVGRELLSCNPGLWKAARATAVAACASVLRPDRPDSTRTRVDNDAGTSTTRSPRATSCWASNRPTPAAPSTAQVRSGQPAANANSRSTCRRLETTRTDVLTDPSALITTAVCAPLCGSIPMICTESSYLLDGRGTRGGQSRWEWPSLC